MIFAGDMAGHVEDVFRGFPPADATIPKTKVSLQTGL
jgi:hypothetical protein